jgi:uroporphyrinogen-III synthase
MSEASFGGLRVLALESRRAVEIAELIRRKQGEPVVAPSMREAPLESNDAAFAFADRLFAGGFDMMIFLTGVGTRVLDKVLATRFPAQAFAEALRKITVVARGPKPSAALREMNVPVAINVPEPNTWREILAALENRTEHRIAVQEYGRPNDELFAGLRARGFEVTAVPVYSYALPEDLGPLRDAVQQLADRRIDVVLFTTSIQMNHLAQIAKEMNCEAQMIAGLRHAVVASIGPSTSETLDDFGIVPDITPTHPKMGYLIKETAEQARELLIHKRS